MSAIELYIGTGLVEFSTDPQILYNYTQNEVNNPTVVKNSFSKTIVIEGTPSNNKLLGQYWNLERIEGAGGTGTVFNSSKKVEFNLFVNSQLYESGYVKLDSVKKNKGKIEYSITLYGGLGEFFYNLNTNDENGEKLKLSDLDFGTDLDFTINMATVKDAWDNIDNTSSKWNIINFMPAYNGLPDDFDADKCLINIKDTELPKSSYRDGKYYTPKRNFVLAELTQDMTDNEMRDYRSYLMRPAIKMNKIIQACCDPINNGGYEVVLDNEFFNNNNTYWADTWLTLPMISQLDLDNSQQELPTASLTGDTTTGENYGAECWQTFNLSMGEFAEETESVTLEGNIAVNGIYSYSSYMMFCGKNSDRSWDSWDCFGSLFCQLVAYNGDTVVGASQTYNLTTPIRHNGNLYYGSNSRYDGEGVYHPVAYNTNIYDRVGIFKYGGFTDENGNKMTFRFTIDKLASKPTTLKMRYFWGSNKQKRKKWGSNWFIDEPYDNSAVLPIFTDGVAAESIPPSDIKFTITKQDIKAVMGDSLGRTGTEIRKEHLLNTENSPCEYLLSYCKQFGLYFRKDLEERKIYIETRNKFYHRDKVYDLSKVIDRGKEITIKPLTFDTKWLQFNSQNEETQFDTAYRLSYGVDYGSKLVNTGYDFASEKNDILKDICIKGGIEGHEKSKFYVAYEKDNTLRNWMVGMTYSLYNGTDTEEVTPQFTVGRTYGLNEGEGMKYYDFLPKLQFHDKDYNGTDGNNVLVFFSGFKSVNTGRNININYILSDDTPSMVDLNEGTPCWLFSPTEFVNDERVCYKLDRLPVFERYRTINGSNSIISSLDYGAPRQLFVQKYEYDIARTIYDTYWKNYIEDLYSVNTKILTCYVLMDDKPNPEWLQRFYWFDNSIWRLNKITDWNVAGTTPTKMEFIKVQDIASYTNKDSKNVSNFSLTLNQYGVGAEGGTLIATIKAPFGQEWVLSWSEGIVPEITSGAGDATFFITVPPVYDNQFHRYTVTARADISSTVTISQNSESNINIVEVGEYVGKNVPEQGGAPIIRIESNYEWTLECDSDWVHPNMTSGRGTSYVQLTFDPTDSFSSRMVTIRVTDTTGNFGEWRKSQEQLSTVYYVAEGETKTFDMGASGIIWNTPDWITVIDNGNGTYSFTASRNPSSQRENGIIGTLPSTKGEGRQYAVKVIQEGIKHNYLTADPTNINVPSEGGTYTINVSSDLDWRIEVE